MNALRLNYNIPNNEFSLEGYVNAGNTDLTFVAQKIPFYTKSYPDLIGHIKKNIPSLLSNECFNEQDNSFEEEVKNTELGHFFEHLVIEYMAIGKAKTTKGVVSYSGFTTWNWDSENEGVFHISVEAGLGDFQYLNDAIKKSLKFISDFMLKEPSSDSSFDKFKKNGLEAA